ncbi:Protein Aster-C [Entomortierella chlamydospora]|nr:Protein Aster-C [Entomortierella chlamydospora]
MDICPPRWNESTNGIGELHGRVYEIGSIKTGMHSREKASDQGAISSRTRYLFNLKYCHTVDDEKFIYSLGRTTSRFDGSMSASSLDLPVTYEFQNQRYFKSNRRPSEYHPASSPDHTFERAGAETPMILSNNTGDYDVSFNQTLAVPIPIQVSSSSSLRGYKFKSPTPPPSLLSPPLTTTKVSRSSSTVHGAAGKGTSPGMIVHVRTGSESADFDGDTGNKVDAPGKLASQNHFTSEELLPKLPHPSSQNGPRAFLSLTRPETTQDLSAPVLCGCERHCQNAILSTVVPIPLDLCFELLFSGQGAGQGDTLTCEAHRRVSGSSDVGITAWTADSLDDNVAGLSGWGKRKRQLEYSVLFKVPMLTKTSTACFETQEILQHSANIIRVQSESRIPNVPYGEQFSTLDQICMTWDSPGNTRIKCFTEVKFKRSIMLSSKVEAASLEVFGGFYRELIRQLVDVAETQSSMVVRPVLSALTSEALIRSPSISSDSATYSKVDDFSSSDLDAITPTSPSIYSRPSGVSAAQSLLSQQYLKSPPTISKHPRFSTSLTFTPAEFTLPGRTSRKITGLALRERRSTATDVLKSIDLLTPSPMETPVLRHQDSIENKGTVADSTTAKSVTKAIDLWTEFMSKGRAIFNKTNAHESHSKPATSEASRECAAACDDAELDPSTLESEPSVLGEPINVPKDKEGSTGLSEIEWAASDNMGSHRLEKPRTKPRLIPHIVIWTFAIGLIISILNAWRLVNTVSSVAHIMQTRNNQVDNAAESPLHNAFGSSVISRHLEKQAYLVPIQIQTEMLRAEIMELKELLEAQKKLHQLRSREQDKKDAELL